MKNILKRRVIELMNDRRSDPLSQVAKLCLLLASYVYSLLVKCHHFFYKVNLLKSYKSPLTVFSVGNITVGGTGKTPFVMMLARRLTKNKRRPAVLIRGYGEDEWKMLEDGLRQENVRIFVGRNRVRLAKVAGEHGFDSLILDDGFQHRPLGRDRDFVLVDSTNPFGNRHLFPRGILREPLASLKRADTIVLTKVDKAGDNNVGRIAAEINKIAPEKTVIEAAHKPSDLRDIRTGTLEDPASLRGRGIALMSAICDPSYFRYTAEGLGANVGLEFIFPDHHFYTERDLGRILEDCNAKGIDMVVTTEKDAVKLKKLALPDSNCRIMVLSIELEIVKGEEELDAVLR